ncbi:MAG: Cna B-type domain-containing protein [Christensenellales bacterium]
MKNKSLWMLLILTCCALIALQPLAAMAGAADSFSSSTHALSWLSGSTSSTISPDKKTLTTTPSQNYTSEHVLNLNFSLTGNADKGAVQIRVPAKIFKDRDGNNIGTVTVPLLQAPNEPQSGNRFNYYIDDATNEVVIVNTSPIDGNFFLTVDLKYQVNPYLVKMTWVATDSEYVYTRNFTATMTAKAADGTTSTFTSNPVTLRYKTSADLDSLSKSRYTSYTSWPSVLGPSPTPRPDGTQPADDYFYVAWSVYANASTDDTMPFDIYIRENNPASPEYGEMIGFSDCTTSGWRPGDVDKFKEAFNPRPGSILNPDTSYNYYSSRNRSYWNPYVVYRYPKTILEYDAQSGTERATVKNQAQGEVKGFDGVSNTLDASASTVFVMPTPTPVPTPRPTGTVPPDRSYGVKYNSGTSYGLINQIEGDYKQPWLLRYNYSSAGQSVGNFYVSSLYNYAWYDSYQGGEYGVRDHTFEWTDNRMYLGGTGVNNRLTDGDYQMTRLRFPTWTEYGPNITDTGHYTSTRAADAHRPITILVEKNGIWSELGTVEKFLEGNATRYRYTPVTGNPVVYPSYIDIQLPEGTTGVRFQHVTNAVYVSYGTLYIETALLRSQKVQEYLANRDSVYVYNYFDAKATDGDGNTRTRSDYHYHRLTRVSPRSYDSKGRSNPVEDLEGQRYSVNYTATMYDETTNPGDMTRDDLISEGILTEQRQSTFYDLLPPGTTVDLDTIKVRGYGLPSSAPDFSHRVEIRDNWKGSGRTMLIVHAQAPAGVQNYYYTGYGSYSYLRSGMVLSFTLYNTWGNVVDNGSYLVNAVAYESHDGALGTGYADVPSSDIPYNLRPYMTDLNGDGNPADRQKNFLYANVVLDYTPLRAFETGFSKAVASPEDPVFGEHTEVMPGGSYTYRLRLNNPLARTKDLVFYDVLETAHKGAEHWQGTLVGVDTAHVASKGVNAKVYYATADFSDMVIAADSNHLDNNKGTIWSETAPADLSTVTAVAIDLRLKTNGQPYIAEAGESVLVNINMQAPVKDVQGYIDRKIRAHNRGLLANRKSTIDGGTFDELLSIEACDPVTVALRGLGLDLDKSSVPASGTVDAPAIVHGGESIDYHISIKNNNIAQAILDIEMEDTIPAGLEIDYANVAYILDDNPTSRRLVRDSTRVDMLADGQKLIFTIVSLAGNEKMTFIVPTRVMSALTDTTTNTFVNQAHIKKIFGKDYDLASPETYHKESVVTVPLTGTKELTGRTIIDSEFAFVLKTVDGAVVERVTNQGGGFAFSPLGFNAPDTYVFTLEEEAGTLDSVVYDSTVYTITVTVTADAQTGELQQPVVTYAKGNTTKTALTFKNIYKTRNFTAQKEWKIRDGGTEIPSDNAPYPNVEFQLYRDGEPYGAIKTLVPTGTPAPGHPVTTGAQWENLPLYRADGLTDAGGNRIESQYTVQEVIVPDGYVMQRPSENTIQNIYWPNARTVHKIWDGLVPEPETVTIEMTIWQEIRKIGKLPSDPYDDIRKYNVGVTMNGKADGYTNPEYDPADPFTLYGEFEPWKFTIILPSSGIYNGDQVNYYYVVEENTITGLDNDYKVGEIVIEKAKGANVTNVYQYTSFTANKVWVNGPEQKPDVQLQLLQDGVPFVAGVGEPTGLVTLRSGKNWQASYTWNNLPRFKVWNRDPANRVEYKYTVKEVIDPGNPIPYETTVSEDGTTVTNTYVIPKTSYKAIKTWAGGPETDHTGVFVNLYRKTDQMAEPEHILLPPGLFVRDDSKAPEEFTYNWTVLDATDINGNPYTFFAREAGVSAEGYVTINGSLYQVEHVDNNNGKETDITNTYVVPKIDVHATKTWVNGPEANYHQVQLTLWCQLEGMEPEKILQLPDEVTIPVVEGQTDPSLPDETISDKYIYTWKNMDERDENGQLYHYFVTEEGSTDHHYVVNGSAYLIEHNGLDITNTYVVPETEITATKIWVDGPVEHHKTVTLILKQNGVAMAPQPEPVITGENPFTYTWSKLPKTAENGTPHVYTVEETGAMDGHITVGDSLYAVVQKGNDISNCYVPPDPAPIAITAHKAYSGRTLKAGDFVFQLLAEDGVTVLEEVKNAADGSVIFSPIPISEKGTKTFKIRELAGTRNDILYDSSVYTLTYEVSLQGDNTLEAALTSVKKNGAAMLLDEPIRFSNEYIETIIYPTIEVPLVVKKELKNGVLKGGEFSFQLKDKPGNILAEVKNAADGTVTFPARSFSKEVKGYFYTIHEVQGTDPNTTYDQAVYTVKISTKAVNGQLVPNISVRKNNTPHAGDMIFTNHRKMPKVGDDTIRIIVLLAGIALILIAGAYYYQRKRSK